jgi:hypothetical protein
MILVLHRDLTLEGDESDNDCGIGKAAVWLNVRHRIGQNASGIMNVAHRT